MKDAAGDPAARGSGAIRADGFLSRSALGLERVISQVATSNLIWHATTIVALPEHVVNVGPQGRIVIPARIRRELGLDEGTALAVRSEDGRLVLEPRKEVLRRLRGRYARVGKRRLSDELVRDRRAEARRESRR